MGGIFGCPLFMKAIMKKKINVKCVKCGNIIEVKKISKCPQCGGFCMTIKPYEGKTK